MKKNLESYNPNPYSSGEVPPCSAFLGNAEPIIKNGHVIFRNFNRLFCFISTASDDPSEKINKVNTNIQISITTYIIGLYINKVQLGIIKYNKSSKIHSDETANEFIHKMIDKSPEVKVDYKPSLKAVVSNQNAILPLFTNIIDINPLNYYILFILNRMEANPGLYFANNDFGTEDSINFMLASLYFETL
ncbi:hypothetical protein [Clostridium sp. 'White wine YQ']|uniref:hypothetical protein n=1 Tax=Clostridium sp. 'White wine YQ' TaxID=3027474 RepID=UPI002365369E|nr:hypothetical protein [Clostridium sp. 'White wine YQ']MDD7793356.1 hypothetical protein [Clostridium sp. 'White wine YQ']